MSRKSFNESVVSTFPFLKDGSRSSAERAVGGQREEAKICRRPSQRVCGGEVTDGDGDGDSGHAGGSWGGEMWTGSRCLGKQSTE